MLDETGLALNLAQARQARADGLEPRFCRPLAEPALARLVAAGRAGRRAGGGFFDWPAEGPRTPWPGWRTLSRRLRLNPASSSNQLRLLAAEAREALRCLEEGVVASADDADAASVLGLGFPKRLGGILRWAEDFGLARLVARLRRLGRRPRRALRRLALAARARLARRGIARLPQKGASRLTGPLKGLRIVEMGGIGPAPFAGALLGDMGADVVRIDRIARPGVEPEIPPRFDFYNRNKRSIALDLKKPEAVAAVLKLVAGAER